jgi:hypothetical protein
MQQNPNAMQSKRNKAWCSEDTDQANSDLNKRINKLGNPFNSFRLSFVLLTLNQHGCPQIKTKNVLPIVDRFDDILNVMNLNQSHKMACLALRNLRISQVNSKLSNVRENKLIGGLRIRISQFTKSLLHEDQVLPCIAGDIARDGDISGVAFLKID